MATARLHPLPLLLVDFFMLTQVLTAGAAVKLSDDSFMPIVDSQNPRAAVGAALLGSGPGNILSSRLVLAAGEKSNESTAPGPGDSKSAPSALKAPKTEKSNAASPAPKAPSAGKGAATSRAPESRTPAKATPMEKPQEQEVADEKSPSVLQMLEGHEKDLLVVVAIALAFFVIGWICGGNYYLRRDRRRRTKLRF